jgi:hypothetical protein
MKRKKKTFSWALVLLICYLVWFGLDFCDSLGWRWTGLAGGCVE